MSAGLAACGSGETPRHPAVTPDGSNSPALVPAPSGTSVTAPSRALAPSSDAGATSSAPAPTATVVPAEPAASAAPTSSAAPEVAQTYAFDDHYPPAESFSLRQYEREHQLVGPTFEQRCWHAGRRVGVPVADGLMCLTENRSPQFTLARVYRLEGNRLRQVWQAIVRTYANWLELTPVLSDDGALILHDQSPGACEGALGEYHAKLDAMKAPPSGELLGPACAKRGKYTYERRQYLLTEPVRRRDFPW